METGPNLTYEDLKAAVAREVTSHDQAEAVIRAIHEGGFVIVPAQMTDRMFDAAFDVVRAKKLDGFSLGDIYAAMIKAAPSCPP